MTDKDKKGNRTMTKLSPEMQETLRQLTQPRKVIKVKPRVLKVTQETLQVSQTVLHVNQTTPQR